MIRQEIRQSIFGKLTKDFLPVVQTKSEATVDGVITLPSAIETGIQPHVYKVATPTGINALYPIISGDLFTGTCLGYTGMGTTVEWTFDPQGIGASGAQHGEIYGIEFRTNQGADASIKQSAPDVIVEIRDSIGGFGLTGTAAPNVYIGEKGATGLQGATGLEGATGIAGEYGAIGVTGVAGVTGVNGVQGATGAVGATGASYGFTGIINFSLSAHPYAATGMSANAQMPTDGTFNNWKCVAGETGVCYVKIEKSSYAEYPVYTQLNASGETGPYVHMQIKNSGGVSGWPITTFDTGDILKISVNSVTGISNLEVYLEYVKSK